MLFQNVPTKDIEIHQNQDVIQMYSFGRTAESINGATICEIRNKNVQKI